MSLKGIITHHMQIRKIDGTAAECFEYSDGSKSWYENGKLHRLDGPAIDWTNGTKEWWVNGVQIDIEKIIATHDLNTDWTQWTEDEKVLFRLAI